MKSYEEIETEYKAKHGKKKPKGWKIWQREDGKSASFTWGGRYYSIEYWEQFFSFHKDKGKTIYRIERADKSEVYDYPNGIGPNKGTTNER